MYDREMTDMEEITEMNEMTDMTDMTDMKRSKAHMKLDQGLFVMNFEKKFCRIYSFSLSFLQFSFLLLSSIIFSSLLNRLC
jgi:uncharacterized membrane protein YjjP (DUF1212 family)